MHSIAGVVDQRTLLAQPQRSTATRRTAPGSRVPPWAIARQAATRARNRGTQASEQETQLEVDPDLEGHSDPITGAPLRSFRWQRPQNHRESMVIEASDSNPEEDFIIVDRLAQMLEEPSYERSQPGDSAEPASRAPPLSFSSLPRLSRSISSRNRSRGVPSGSSQAVDSSPPIGFTLPIIPFPSPAPRRGSQSPSRSASRTSRTPSPDPGARLARQPSIRSASRAARHALQDARMEAHRELVQISADIRNQRRELRRLGAEGDENRRETTRLTSLTGSSGMANTRSGETSRTGLATTLGAGWADAAFDDAYATFFSRGES